MIAASAVTGFGNACVPYRVKLDDSDICEIILGIRSRLEDTAVGCNCEELVNAALFVLHPLVAELKFASVGQGLDSETLAAWTWEVLLASAGTTKALSKLSLVTSSEEIWNDINSVEAADDAESGFQVRLTDRKIPLVLLGFHFDTGYCAGSWFGHWQVPTRRCTPGRDSSRHLR